jgi:predicted Holliday junction resolvase-like endonuclease
MGEATVSQVGAAIVAGALIGAAVAATLLVPWITRLQSALERERSRRGSLASTYGRISEQWFPLCEAYPYDSRDFRFIGSPIDGIQFGEDRVIFCEFKANHSELSDSQKRICDLVRAGRVEWQEFRFTDGERLPEPPPRPRPRRRTRRWE